MNRTVGAELDVTAHVESQVELQIAVARSPGLEVDDTLVVTHEGRVLDVQEVPTTHHGRLHTVTLPAGPSHISYSAHVRGRADLPTADPADLSLHRRPSRYAESDRLGPFAAAEFAGIGPAEVLDAVSSWVGTRLSYVPGSSGPLDGALETLLAGTGVCRDYAHLAVALLRSLGVPARLVAVYAPGCDPMDFHAVVEAHVAGGWHVVDATALAPRTSLVRIATGRDAADTAFMATVFGNVSLDRSTVTAVADDGLPDDDLGQLVVLR
ncbi:Transglutaminase-like superfamily protein [Nocardioides alpinus]|uniref:Transglutaminase family protein n=1 Tax=Nocardioides alpinus TaxID=748909 RepID=A0A1I0WZJ4_9ACTN|nr:transglutaminase family protein [Nocardioides alpinus]PKH44014.1 transglutaminase family protein [Nocardioides alpinus]SFA93837.1 Transglutaminase-like superfamily protein [Nocardioides alpinus]